MKSEILLAVEGPGHDYTVCALRKGRVWGIRASATVAMLFIVPLALHGCSDGVETHQWDFDVMGTVARVEIFHPERSVAQKGFEHIRAVFDSVEAVMSTWDPASEISHVNRAPAGSTLVVSQWLNECLSHAEDVGAATGGAFDPTAEPLMRLWGFYRREGRLPSEAEIDSVIALMGDYVHDRIARSVVKGHAGTSFDLGGIAKGYALDRAAESLAELGIENALIDLGGNLICLGAPPGRGSWRVGIRDPHDRDKLFAVVKVRGGALATSGSYERYVVIDGRRYGHIMNPATGRPAEGLLSVTVLASNATLADGLSTALFVLGFEEGRRLLAESFPEVEAVFVVAAASGKKPRVIVDRRLEARFVLLGKMEDTYTVEFF